MVCWLRECPWKHFVCNYDPSDIDQAIGLFDLFFTTGNSPLSQANTEESGSLPASIGLGDKFVRFFRGTEITALHKQRNLNK
ncbi:hypothetical protein Y032_0031g2395 [Ancylostoma ceylanicum]|uniref:Uncharacterized protein n=1 Tax=Ancylostoma ceylanicum TaxID=53326 RepID=A0A016UR52_9BILA|nr:hypothetical protein Y032_0031g2395 [Ancylostoma ceylanicum]